MTVSVRRLFPAGLMACLAAPVAYLLYVVGMTLVEGRTIDLPLLLTIAATSTMFSFVITMALVLLTVGVARVMRLDELNVITVAATYLLLLGAATWALYGLPQAAILWALAIPNASALVWASTRPRA